MAVEQESFLLWPRTRRSNCLLPLFALRPGIRWWRWLGATAATNAMDADGAATAGCVCEHACVQVEPIVDLDFVLRVKLLHMVRSLHIPHTLQALVLRGMPRRLLLHLQTGQRSQGPSRDSHPQRHTRRSDRVAIHGRQRRPSRQQSELRRRVAATAVCAEPWRESSAPCSLPR